MVPSNNRFPRVAPTPMKKPLPLCRLLANVLARPEGLRPVDDRLGLGRNIVEVDGSSQDDTIALLQGLVYRLHVVFHHAPPRLLTTAATPAPAYLESSHPDPFTGRALLLAAPKELVQEDVRIASLPGASVEAQDEHFRRG